VPAHARPCRQARENEAAQERHQEQQARAQDEAAAAATAALHGEIAVLQAKIAALDGQVQGLQKNELEFLNQGDARVKTLKRDLADVALSQKQVAGQLARTEAALALSQANLGTVVDTAATVGHLAAAFDKAVVRPAASRSLAVSHKSAATKALDQVRAWRKQLLQVRGGWVVVVLCSSDLAS
jgi:chromosome segregation ATPase